MVLHDAPFSSHSDSQSLEVVLQETAGSSTQSAIAGTCGFVVLLLLLVVGGMIGHGGISTSLVSCSRSLLLFPITPIGFVMEEIRRRDDEFRLGRLAWNHTSRVERISKMLLLSSFAPVIPFEVVAIKGHGAARNNRLPHPLSLQAGGQGDAYCIHE